MTFEALNVRETRAWLLARKKGLERAPARALANKDYLAETKLIATEAVDQVVYSVPETPNYERTEKTRDSVDVDSPRDGEMEIFIPLTPETAAIAGESRGVVSYPRFMLEGIHQHSFHQYELPRDFLELWFLLLLDFGPQMVVEEIDRELKK